MKRFFFFLISLALLSCAKEEPSLKQTPNGKLGLKLYSSLSSLKDIESKQVAFGMLTPEEKLGLWRARFFSESKSGKFSESQIIAIQELSSLLSVEFFKKGNPKEIFKNITLPKWIDKTHALFTKEEIYNLIFNIGNNTTMSEMLRDCNCAVGSHWTCYLGGGNFAKCYLFTWGGSCNVKPSGCGALWDDECDGDFCTNGGDPNENT